MKLILVRHSISNHNLDDTISGAQSDPELSQAGIDKAKSIYPKLNLDKIDKIYSSPLKRALQTAEILTNRQKKIILDPRLLEMNFGSWEGQHAIPLYQKYPDAFDTAGLISNNYVKYAKNAESYQDLIERVQTFYNQLKSTSSNQTVMIVCHGFTIRAFVAILLGTDIAKIDVVDNVAFTEFKIDPENSQAQMLTFNQKSPSYYGI